VTECDAVEALPDDLQRPRFTLRSEVEPRLRSNIGVAPAVEDDTGDMEERCSRSALRPPMAYLSPAVEL
jgi:hypothetical protein